MFNASLGLGHSQRNAPSQYGSKEDFHNDLPLSLILEECDYPEEVFALKIEADGQPIYDSQRGLYGGCLGRILNPKTQEVVPMKN